MKLGVMVPCFVDACFPNVAATAFRILKRLGYSPEFISEARCCGQPLYTLGASKEASQVAKQTVHEFDPYSAIIVLSGSCTAMIRGHYHELGEGLDHVAERTLEFSEFLVAQGHLELGASYSAKAALHVGCHGMRGIQLTEPMQLLDRVQGLTILPDSERATCCGFGGAFAVKMPEVSVAMGQTKLDAFREIGAEVIISTEAACAMHLQGILKAGDWQVPLLHYVEVLSPE